MVTDMIEIHGEAIGFVDGTAVIRGWTIDDHKTSLPIV